MPSRKLRIYADTSAYGGCFDVEFRTWSHRLFEEVRADVHRLLISDVVIRELTGSPERVRQILEDLPDSVTEQIVSTEESLDLAHEYLTAGVLGPRHLDDAAHVALATIAHADVIASWNFRHLVKLDRIRAFNAINLRLGFPIIEIRSPREIIHEPTGD